MTTPARAIVALAIASSIAGASGARVPVPKAETIIAAAKQATGGTAWDKPQGCFEEGTRGDGAISYQTRFSLRDYGIRIDSNRGGNTRSMGFNGKVRWQSSGDGKVEARSDAASLQEGFVTNYLSINGFFFPSRFPADFKYLRAAKEGLRQFDVIQIAPKYGRALEVWFDRRTHLIQRVIDTHGSPAVRVEASDYRRVAGLSVAYKLDVFGPDGSVVDRGTVTSFRCGSIENNIFDAPSNAN